MPWKRRGVLRTFIQLSGQFVTHAAGGLFRVGRRDAPFLVDARELLVGITMAVLPGCAFLTFVDEQDAGAFLVSRQTVDQGEQTATPLPDGVSVEVETATWWATEVLVRVRIQNDSSEPLELAAAASTLTFLEPIQAHHVKTPAYCASGDSCLLAEIGLLVDREPWQKVRPFGDVQASRSAAEAKASLPSDAVDAPFIVPPGKAAVLEVEFEAPRMAVGEFVLGLKPSGPETPGLARYELRRAPTRTKRSGGGS